MTRRLPHVVSRPPRSLVRRVRAKVRDETGLSMVGLLMLAPILMMALEIVALGGRFAVATADIQSAAHEAARQATIARSRASANGLVGPVAEAALVDKGFQCQNPQTTIVGSGTDFTAGGQVEVRVSCSVRLSDLDLLGVPGVVRINRQAIEPIDTFRAVD